MRHLDLFSGIGGFALAARWMGWQTVGFCEIEAYPQAVLRKNFPAIPIFDDVRTLDATQLAGLGRIDLVTGGFPCQDVSTAGKRAGLSGARSGLWAEMFRIVCTARPAWVVAENVPGLRTIGADRVLADLAEAGYTAWPCVVGALHTGAPHRRQRVWIVAHAIGGDLRDEPRRNGCELADRLEPRCAGTPEPGHDGAQGTAADATQFGWREGRAESARIEGRYGAADGRDADAANAECAEWRPDQAQPAGRQQAATVAGDGRYHCSCGHAFAASLGKYGCPNCCGERGPAGPTDAGLLVSQRHKQGARHDVERVGIYRPDWQQWTDAPQPAVRAVDDGLPAWVAGCRVPALKALGNAIVPQVAWHIFRAIEASRHG